MLEISAVKKLVPKAQRTLITQEFLDRIEQSVADSTIANEFKENFITYLNVLSSGKYKMEDYICAIKYVSFKLLEYSNRDAYISTFPDRYQRLKDTNTLHNIDNFVAAYNKNKLVLSIYEQTIVPSYVLNAPLHQKALTELARMIDDPEVRGLTKVKACETILQYTKQPDIVKGQLTIDIGQSDTISDLREATEALVTMQKNMLSSGSTTLRELTESTIIDVTSEDD